MIARLVGEIVEKNFDTLVIDVNGVGYEVRVTLLDGENMNIGDDVRIYTYHHIREQSQELFGFSSLVSKKLFELLITVQGVGPKAALAILSLGDSEEVRNAIACSDSAYISSAVGIGKKTADRVVVDLSDKVGNAQGKNENQVGTSNTVVRSDEALEALMALGYNLNDAMRLLKGVSAELSTAERVTQALKGRS